MSESDIKCQNPHFLGKGGEGIVIKCNNQGHKYLSERDFVVKLADPTIDNDNCKIENERYLGFYINEKKFTKPLLFNGKIGKDNIIKYHNLRVSTIDVNSISEIETDDIKKINAEIADKLGEEKQEATKRLKQAIESIKNTINNAMQSKSQCAAVIEYCDQGDLYQFIANHPEYISNPGHFKDMIYQIFSGLMYFFNKKICHWDLKPENILVKTNTGPDKDSRKYIFKLADYGTVLIQPNAEIKEKLEKDGVKLMTNEEGLNFIKEKLTLITTPIPNEKQKLDLDDLVKSQNPRTFELKDSADINYNFQSTPKYTPPKLLSMATYYRDLYAFVLCIYMILVRNDKDYTEKNNPNDLYENSFQKSERNQVDNLPMSVLASKKKDHNYIYKYYSSKILKLKTKYLNLGYQAKLLWNIARVVKNYEEQIESKFPKVYYIKDPKLGSGKPTYYLPKKYIINVDTNFYKKLYEDIGELFETRIGKTLKKINERKKTMAARTKKLNSNAANNLLSIKSSASNDLELELDIPENIEDLLDKHIVFFNSTTNNLDKSATVPLAWNYYNPNLSFFPKTSPNSNNSQKTNSSGPTKNRPSFKSHKPPLIQFKPRGTITSSSV